MRGRLLLVVFCCAASSCDAITGPPFPGDDLRPFAAPPQYAYWWSMVERCSGRTGELSKVEWYQTNYAPIVVDGEEYDGYWWRRGNRNAVTEPSLGRLVRHEMLHALLNRGDHPLDVFAGKCEGVVAFEAPESFGATREQLAAARPVRADSALDIELAVDPAEPRASERGGWFTVTVTATNRTNRPVWIDMPGYSGIYVYQERMLGTAMPTNALRVFFAPGQRRRVVLDDRADTAGTFHVRAGYARAVTGWRPLIVQP